MKQIKLSQYQEKENIIPITQGFPAGKSRTIRNAKNNASQNTPIIHSNNHANYLYDQQLSQFYDQLKQSKDQEYAQDQLHYNEEITKSFVRYPKSSRGEKSTTSHSHYGKDKAVVLDIKDLKQLQCFLLENDLQEEEETITSKDAYGESNNNTISHPSQYSEKNQSESSYYREKIPPFREINTNVFQKTSINMNQQMSTLPLKSHTRQKSANQNFKEKPEKSTCHSKPSTRQGRYCFESNEFNDKNYQTINHNEPQQLVCTCINAIDQNSKNQGFLQERSTNINSFRELTFCQLHSQYQKGMYPQNNNSSISSSNTPVQSYSSQRRPITQKINNNNINNQLVSKQMIKQQQEYEDSTHAQAHIEQQQKRTSSFKRRGNSQNQKSMGQNSVEVSLFQYLQNPINCAANQNIILSNEFGRMHSKSVFSVSKDQFCNQSNNNSNIQQNYLAKSLAQQSEERKNFNKAIHNVLINFKAMQQTQSTLPPMIGNNTVTANYQIQQFSQPVKSQFPSQKQEVEDTNQSNPNDHQLPTCTSNNIFANSNNSILNNNNDFNNQQKVNLPSINKNNPKQVRSLSFNGANYNNKSATIYNSNQINLKMQNISSTSINNQCDQDSSNPKIENLYKVFN